VPSKQDTGFKNTRAEVGPSTGGTIAPGEKSASKPSKPKSFGISASSSSSGVGKKFCAVCGTPRGAGAFCSHCGDKL